MADFDLWAAIAKEREALATDLAPLTDEQWGTPSLCDGWSVQDVLGHMTAAASKTPPGFFVDMLKAGFNFTKMANADVRTFTAGGPKATLDRFRSIVTSRKHPPGPNATWLGEAIVHGEDIRRPLRIDHAYDPDALRAVADFYKGSNLIIGAKKRIAGLQLKATDADWSNGTGPLVEGPLKSLVMAMTGRKAAYDDLAGDGVATLRGR
jgi:uncharacterized protein (TIGR03083 family)